MRALFFFVTIPLLGQNAVRPGQFVIEPPTLNNLGFEWKITGDDNRNATVAVQFRKVGEGAWREAQPLLRIGGERVYRDRENLSYMTPHTFAGSILNVDEGAEYECRFTMSDPDGVQGSATQTLKVKTRKQLQPYAGGRVLHVYPPDWQGTKQEPNFTSVPQAYYGAGLGDWNVVWERRAQPGDTILMHAGLYKSNRLDYVDPMMAPFDGMYSLTLKGTAEKPITIKAAGDGEVLFDGAGAHRLFDVMASEYHIFDGLTFRNVDIAIFAGQKEVLGAKGLTVRNCRFEDVGVGVTTEYAGSRDFTITDNLFLGRENRFRLVGWTYPGRFTAGLYGSHELRSYFAVKVYGQGHVVAHNSIAYFHDAICLSTYGTPDPNNLAASIDILNNDMHVFNDDFIETDGGVHNIRVMRNRGVNAAQGGLSAQPVFGGPVYFVGNVMYNIWSGVSWKFTAKPAGLLVYHNTVISEHTMKDPQANVHFRNNLFLGRDMPERGIANFANSSSYHSYDYDGFRPNAGVAAQYGWLSPKAGERIYEPSPGDWKAFRTLKELQDNTGQEKHGMEVDYDIFVNLKPPSATDRHGLYHAVDLNFVLKPGAKVVDAGLPLANVNDGYAGKAPDLGALEVGKPLPVFGARWIQGQPFYR
jgi:hypothetical protein